MCFRVWPRSLLKSLMKLSATAVNNSIQQQYLLPLFCHKELHLRCYIGFVLNIVTWSMSILKSIRWYLLWSSAILGKYEKLTLLDALKKHFLVFCITLNFFAFNIKWIKWIKSNESTHWHKLWLCYKFLRSI